ncbi:unnamed protein product [Nezara viridula]|uniref:Uncharacterized protein n=1 Tax=Nezara viridula TaxID=85310 RepID=A0A9P0E5Y1_NEZVI|nr:unnamed protein product [Nezara viridula]
MGWDQEGLNFAEYLRKRPSWGGADPLSGRYKRLGSPLHPNSHTAQQHQHELHREYSNMMYKTDLRKILVSFLASCAYGAQLNSYLPPRPGAGAGVGIVSPPTYPGAGGGSGPGGYAPSGPVIPILSYENNPNQGDGQYSYR